MEKVYNETSVNSESLNVANTESRMLHYIGCKHIKAEPEIKDDKEGYKVQYSDNYISWSPKDVFEKAYFNVYDINSTFNQDIERFISSIDFIHDGKDIILELTCINGYVITEFISVREGLCYEEQKYKNFMLKKVKQKLREHLEFLRLFAFNGIKVED